ncbi:hypothetical protein B9T24_08695 [Acinetobacter sp. ANC 4654]|uniref:hypothetical protein n=1 Tax=Acinetobacter sp. ANC 4654 TaxID=1977872 RepID=UPI000A347AD7|nr:hypothetical protein [Acinetobacter sp. ANC 4654]OTG95836.1 hypothetical protein B9T24_08695 [Acinetobacter sp. ANC 4654]
MKLLKPISDEDQKLLLTDNYYSALKMLPILFEEVIERRFSSSDIEAIRKTLEIQHFSFKMISFVIYAPFIVRQWVRGNSFVEFRSEQLLSLASGRQNLGNFIHLTSLFNYVAENLFSMSVFKYNRPLAKVKTTSI